MPEHEHTRIFRGPGYTVKAHPKSCFFCQNYLVEKVDAGSPRYLFRTKQDLDDYLEAKELRVKIRTALDWWNLQNLPISKLRAIKEILDGGEE